MKKGHATVEGPMVRFDYAAKGRQQRLNRSSTPRWRRWWTGSSAAAAGIDELLAYKEGGRWRDVKSQDINDYLKEITGADFSAKDFRTWSATVLAAWFLALSGSTPRRQDRPQARPGPGGQAGGQAPGQHPGGVPLVLHRPASRSTATTAG